MSDIVERLRDNSRRTSYRPGVDDLILEAADEIERLRGLLREAYPLLDPHNWYSWQQPPIAGLRSRIDAALAGSTAIQPSAATENPEAMYSPVAREGHAAGASARQIDVAAGAPPSACNHFPGQSTCEWCGAVQPERCCLDYPRCDCNSPPEPDGAPALQPCGHPWKAQHDSKCILCSSPGVTP